MSNGSEQDEGGAPAKGKVLPFDDSDDDPFPAAGFRPAPVAAPLFREPAEMGPAREYVPDPPEWATEPIPDPSAVHAHERQYERPSNGNGAHHGPEIEPEQPPRVHPIIPPLDWPALQERGDPPGRRWAIKGWLGFGHVTLLVGQGGIGKSLLAQALASSLSIGKPFIDEIEGRLTCLAWHCEDDHDELWRRERRIAEWLNVPLTDFDESLILIPRAGEDNCLVSGEFGKLLISPLISELEQQAQDYRADVVILDNVGQLYQANENQRGMVTSFLNLLTGILPGKAILLLAHPSRGINSEFSGSSAWENTARSRWYLGATMPGEPQDEEPSEDVRYLGRRKANYSAKDTRRFQYRNGVLIPDDPDADQGIIGYAKREKAESVVMRAVQTFYIRQLRTVAGSRSSDWIVRKIIEADMQEGVGKGELSKALARLQKDGKVVEQPFGKGKDRHDITTLCVA
jgi:RecA-family ATPase